MTYAAVIEARRTVERSPEMERLRRVLARKGRTAGKPYAAVLEAAEIVARSPEIVLLRRVLARRPQPAGTQSRAKPR